mmetsp:Transcript_13073/g.21434  ORF Transcript_13073/g.21434 Transcript_13073/m.21434 type:complete len:493 (-) Transcript_13073:1154-2632(-)|eukprot:CAMPEP_0184645264 /NCGR_PEP_ID=MMETSP0308-20130426/1758_1 /TAXON_ID=38269 /ORGANISM="Gloeochaete witrockiana, Strain SAG 46.84" /LENGTH=492 /DNA_ID=CAMNT_0027074145 /DNA_START=191 /DNA_END=1669 /DNA_ORIENTATION=+
MSTPTSTLSSTGSSVASLAESEGPSNNIFENMKRLDRLRAFFKIDGNLLAEYPCSSVTDLKIVRPGVPGRIYLFPNHVAFKGTLRGIGKELIPLLEIVNIDIPEKGAVSSELRLTTADGKKYCFRGIANATEAYDQIKKQWTFIGPKLPKSASIQVVPDAGLESKVPSAATNPNSSTSSAVPRLESISEHHTTESQASAKTPHPDDNKPLSRRITERLSQSISALASQVNHSGHSKAPEGTTSTSATVTSLNTNGASEEVPLMRKMSSRLTSLVAHGRPGTVDADDKLTFDPHRLLYKFQAASLIDEKGEKQVPGLAYTIAIRELGKIFDKLKMGFIRDDINSKTDILLKTLRSEEYLHTTVHTFVRGEVAKKKAAKKNSASWCVVWLNRVTIFLRMFVGELVNPSSKLESYDIASNAYAATLKPYHPWIVRNTVPTLLKLVPQKKSLVTLLGLEGDTASKEMREFLEVLKPIEASVTALIHEVKLQDLIEA